MELETEGETGINIVGINGIDYSGHDPSNMIGGRVLAWCQDNNEDKVWISWGATIRDFFILDPNGVLVDKINLTAFNPDPTVDNGTNYTELKNLLLAAGNP
ncbi:MAG: hypothetical protein V1244_05650 [Nitrospinaceae bacterium]|nr:hypothetical protein [Nitrospinaceae bacterium]MEE1551091.1 hypothetical protein [Nitrospinaceae bacterium]